MGCDNLLLKNHSHIAWYANCSTDVTQKDNFIPPNNELLQTERSSGTQKNVVLASAANRTFLRNGYNGCYKQGYFI